MTQKISKGLYAFITLTILLVGAFFMVKAMESNESHKADEIYWFSISSTGAIENFLYKGVTPPCDGSGDLCAVGLLESRNEVDPGDSSTDPTPLISNPNLAQYQSMGELNSN